MGIKGLLQLCSLRESTFYELANELSVELMKKPKILIDGYVILHKYAIGYAEPIVKNENMLPKEMIMSIINYIGSIEQAGFDICIVFDGRPNNLKFETNQKRKQIREEALEKHEWKSAVKITAEHVNILINVIKVLMPKWEYMIAPFEADSQLAYLEKIEYGDVIYTVDTDVIIYGAKRVIIKDQKGILQYYKRYSQPANGDIRLVNQLPDYKLFLIPALVGCDYFKGIYGIGIKHAMNLLHYAEPLFVKPDVNNIRQVLVSVLNLDFVSKRMKKMTISTDENDMSVGYARKRGLTRGKLLEQMDFAITGFMRHPVYDPIQNKLITFLGEECSFENCGIFGNLNKMDIQKEIIEGKRNPITCELYKSREINEILNNS